MNDKNNINNDQVPTSCEAVERVASGQDLSVRHYLLGVFTQNLLRDETVTQLTKIIRCSKDELAKQLEAQYDAWRPDFKKPRVPYDEKYQGLVLEMMDCFYETLPAENVQAEGHFSRMTAFDNSLYARLQREPKAVVRELENLSYTADDKDLFHASIAMYLQERLEHGQTDKMHRVQRLLSMRREVVDWHHLNLNFACAEAELSISHYDRRTISEFLHYMVEFFNNVKKEALDLLTQKSQVYEADKAALVERTLAANREITLLGQMSADDLYNWLYTEACQVAKMKPDHGFSIVK